MTMILAGAEPWLTPARILLRESGCVIRKYRVGPNGIAYTKDADWGIEVPMPTNPQKFAVFAHEVGHQLMHRHPSGKPRWLEEIEAEGFALDQFERFELELPEKQIESSHKHLALALRKAIRRGADPSFPALPERWRFLLERDEVRLTILQRNASPELLDQLTEEN